MKHLAQFLFILSCTSYAYDQSIVTKSAIKKELTTRCGTANCRGPRGPRGHHGDRGPRGHRGPRGTSGSCGLNELFLNANMLTGIDAEAGLQSPLLFSPYGPNNLTAFVAAWAMFPSTFVDSYTVGANFDIPQDLDITKPVTVVLHFLVALQESPGNQAKIQLQADYKNSGDELGAPVPGFADTQVSVDFTITEPTISTNLRQISIPISLDITKITGPWAIIQVRRIAPASNEYSNAIYLSTISVQYSRIC